jgi:hypothetical protein
MGRGRKSSAEGWSLCKAGSRWETRWSAGKATVGRRGMGKWRATKGTRSRSGSIRRGSAEVLRRLVAGWGEGRLRWHGLWRVLGMVLGARRAGIWRVVWWLLIRGCGLRAVFLGKRPVTRSWWSSVCGLRGGVRRRVLQETSSAGRDRRRRMTYICARALAHGALHHTLHWRVATTTSICSLFSLLRFMFCQSLLQICR